MKIMNKLIWTLLAVMLLSVVSFSAHAANLPINVDRFRMDDIDLTENAVNRLDVQRNNEYVVEITFTPTQDIKNLQLKIFASGFEYSDISPIESNSRVFDADSNVTYVRRFKLKLTDQVEEDDYKIRIIFSDRSNNELVKNYNVKFDVPRHSIKVEDAVFYPAGGVQAGQSLLATVRLENQGEKVENDIRVDVAIAGLGISGTDYISEIKNGGNREKGTEEIFMRIPECAKPGTYDVQIKATYNQLHDVVMSKSKVDVLENPACSAPKKSSVPDTVIIVKQSAPPAQPPASEAVSTAGEEQKSSSTLSKVRTVLESLLILLIALLVIVAIIIAFRGLGAQDSDGEAKKE